MTSYISDQDLEALDPTPASLTPQDPANPQERRKSVSFHPLALLIPCAPDGEKDNAMCSSYAADLKACGGRRAVGVKSWVVEKPTISPTKAFSKLYDGLSSSLQPLLSTSGGGGVCSTSTNYGYSARTSRGLDLDDSRDQERREARGFIPSPTTMTVKLPGLTRNRSQSTSKTREGRCGDVRGILRAGSLPTTLESGGSTSLATEKTSILSTSPSSILGTLPIGSPSRPNLPIRASSFASTLSSNSSLAPLVCSISPTHVSSISPASVTASSTNPIIPVPIAPCCPHCSPATEYGTTSGEEYKEKWSKGAKKKRKADKESEAGEVGKDEKRVPKVDELDLGMRGRVKSEESEGSLKELAEEIEESYGLRLEGMTEEEEGSALTTPEEEVGVEEAVVEEEIAPNLVRPPTPPSAPWDLPRPSSPAQQTDPSSPPVSPESKTTLLPLVKERTPTPLLTPPSSASNSEDSVSSPPTSSSTPPESFIASSSASTPKSAQSSLKSTPAKPVPGRKMSIKSLMGGWLDSGLAGSIAASSGGLGR